MSLLEDNPFGADGGSRSVAAEVYLELGLLIMVEEVTEVCKVGHLEISSDRPLPVDCSLVGKGEREEWEASKKTLRRWNGIPPSSNSLHL